jgi:gamma-glutamylcyclotransferase (GGCT)/AIG2-like uncharacterized protein YtfP
MEQLFVYGSLKKPEVQKSVFGRVAKSFPDILQDYTRSKIKIENIYPIIFPKKRRYVRGLIFLVNSEELKLIDAYETRSYRRQKVFLRSGVRAWVYTK